jgi:hypothetical protein
MTQVNKLIMATGFSLYETEGYPFSHKKEEPRVRSFIFRKGRDLGFICESGTSSDKV